MIITQSSCNPLNLECIDQETLCPPNPLHPAQALLEEKKENVTFQEFFGVFFRASFFFSRRAESDITLRLMSSAPSVQGGKTSRNLWHSEFPVDFYPDGADFFFPPSEEEKRSVRVKQRRCGNAVTQCGRGLEDV